MMLAKLKLMKGNVQKFAVRLLIGLLAGSAVVWACSWNFTTDHSVRFNSNRTGRGFYRLEPLPIMYDTESGRELSVREMNPDDADYRDDEPLDQAAENEKIVELVGKAISETNLSEAESLLKKLLDTTAERTIGEDPNRQERRNSAFDMLDALAERRNGVQKERVKEYLEARLRFDRNTEIGEIPANLPARLRDNWDYLQGAELYRLNRTEESLEAFRRHSTAYPSSEKNQAVLYMIAKLRIEASHAVKTAGCGITGYDYYGRPYEPEPEEACRDKNWKRAIEDLKRLLIRYPNGKFVNDAKGWLAFLYRRGGMREMALAEYYRLLGHPTDRNARLEAKKSLQILGHEYDDDVLDKTEALISADVNASMAYAYHRIYNFAVDLTYAEDEFYGSNREERKRQLAETHQKGRHELERVARFSARMMSRYPNARVSGGFLVRLAEAQLELERFAEAADSAGRALSRGIAGELRAQALFIKASSEHQAKKYGAAKRTLTELIRAFPRSKHIEHARRLLALTAEDTDDLESALELYFKLGYRYDVAYFVDVLLPVERLEKFIATRTDEDELNYLRYALGIRLMREKEWEKARQVLLKVATANIPLYSNDYGWERAASFEKDPYQYDYDGMRIGNSWIMRDIKTIEVFQYLEKLAAEAADDEARAEALYQLASAYYQADSLTFYNPAAWDGNRANLLEQLHYGKNTRFPNERTLIFEHSQSHESLAKSIPIFLEVVDKYPNTRAAKDALFSAVVGHERLGDLNSYWRGIYEQKLFAGPRMVTNADINGRFPKFNWPLSRLGWEPATRTVNGGHAYPPPPKPAPRLSFTQRVERKVSQYGPAVKKHAREIWAAAEVGIRHLLVYLLFGLGLFAYWRYRMLK
jgi:outer membrane protein assembly factor BamD (BamD/ComL family)